MPCETWSAGEGRQRSRRATAKHCKSRFHTPSRSTSSFVVAGGFSSPCFCWLGSCPVADRNIRRPCRSAAQSPTAAGRGPRAAPCSSRASSRSEGFPGRPGMAPFDTQGRFVVTTWENVEGLMPGQYRVGIECWKLPPSKDNPRGVSYLPAKYCNASNQRHRTYDHPRRLGQGTDARRPPRKIENQRRGKDEKEGRKGRKGIKEE